MESRCRQEIEELHRFFQDWFNGESTNDASTFARLDAALGAGFFMVTPEGNSVERPPLVAGLRGAHGRWREAPGKIWIENIQLRHAGANEALLTCEEWQQVDGETKGRLSSVLFVNDDDAPNGVAWLHLHEGWIVRNDGHSGR